MINPLICVVGASGSGKDSVVRNACEKTGWKQVISYATRPRREGEGDTHIFITEDEVKQYENDFAAWTRINGFQYFTTKTQLRDPAIKFYIIDPNGVQWLKQNFTERPVYVIYLYVLESIAKERAIKRGDPLQVYTARRESEKEQFARFEKNKEYDLIIHNALGIDFTSEDLICAVDSVEREG